MNLHERLMEAEKRFKEAMSKPVTAETSKLLNNFIKQVILSVVMKKRL